MHCINCGKEIAENSKYCPNCGIDVNNKKGQNKNILIIMSAFIVLLLITILGISCVAFNKTKKTAVTISSRENILSCHCQRLYKR